MLTLLKRFRDRLFPPRCEHPGCRERDPIACWHDDPDEVVARYCPEHAEENGYCWSCGQFGAGIEAFDFGRHPGLCEMCEAEIDDWEDDEDIDDLDEELAEDFESEYDLYRDM